MQISDCLATIRQRWGILPTLDFELERPCLDYLSAIFIHRPNVEEFREVVSSQQHFLHQLPYPFLPEWCERLFGKSRHR